MAITGLVYVALAVALRLAGVDFWVVGVLLFGAGANVGIWLWDHFIAEPLRGSRERLHRDLMREIGRRP